MSRPVAIVSDSTHYLPAEIVERLAITQVGLYVNRAEDNSREVDITDYALFYEQLRDSTTLPTTSQPSVGDFSAAYEALVKEGKDVVSIHLSGGISGTVGAAAQARDIVCEDHPDATIEVIDSTSTAGGLGFVLFAAAAAVTAGADVTAVAQRAREASDKQHIWFAVDTLEYLRRGGRIGNAQAWLGGALKIKPILTIRGEITPIERVRTAGRAFERMVSYAHELADSGSDAWMIQHIQAHEQAERLLERGREIFGHDPLCISEVGPVIGTYTGPGLLGIGGVPSALLG